MPKFFIKTENLKENEEIWITGSDVNHIKNVLRKKVDDKINICNSDTQKNYECIIKNIEENKKMQNKEETKNGLFILGGATIVLAVIGIIVIVWKKRK